MAIDQARSDSPAIDEAKLHAFLGQVVGDLGAAMSAACVVVGHKLGLYRAMAGAGAITSDELAALTGTTERYIREWLVNQAAGGYLAYDPSSGRYRLPPEQAVALADASSPAYVVGGFQVVAALAKAEPRITEAFRTGGGMLWGEHDHGLFHGTEEFFRASYTGNLISAWIPALEGVQAKLKAGATVADVGCGHGASTIIMATAFPRSRFHGFDNHAPSIERARAAAAEAGVADRVTFEHVAATDYPDYQYDLIAFFDCLHDMGDPIGAARRAFQTLKPDGTAMIVEPMAGDTVESNLNPVGRVYSAASVLCCTPNAIAAGGPALGTIASDTALRTVVTAGGFTRFRRATETPFNRVFEARR
jgi:2-polyprenyl-3-methyl-5-hydroxy-6-metoxy-1,4-benzoquinol methylase